MTEQLCPICKGSVKPQPRYPSYICEPCLSDGVEVNGQVVPKSELDVYSNQSINCKVHTLDCIAQEARFGGTVVQAI